MTFPRPLALACCAAALFTGGVHAQLKPPADSRNPAGGLGAPSSAPAQPAARPQPAAPAREAAPAKGDPQKEDAGRTAAAGWLLLLDRKDWGTAWETSAGMFRSAVPLSAWMDGIPKVREPLGTLVERTPAETIYRTQLEGRPAGDYVSVKFNTRFDQRQVQELVTTVREPDGRWRVTGYSAQPR
ncbi:DUF4019 domain-containing protein [Ramlibacter tataouinensis]|uniref:DUF4019 domain-containing protein n=1 Tax=Ramlibacter tataouinensis TaxID=94132 RepID=UPI0003101650|nr:DUF4019 domain-containing protein [Ramlibacter tataouinensis]